MGPARLILPALLVLTAGRLAAQWRLGVEAGSETMAGVTGNREPGGPVFGLEGLRWIGLRLEAPGPAATLHWMAAASFASPSLALTAPEVTIIDRRVAVAVAALRAGIVVTLHRFSSVVAIRAEAAPVLERWRFASPGPQLRAGAEAGASLAVALAGRWSLAAGGFLGITPVSPLAGLDLPEGIEPRGAWRRAVRGSVCYGW